MNRTRLTLAAICFGSAVVMFQVGSTNSHLTELADLFWVPLPLGAVLALAGMRRKS